MEKEEISRKKSCEIKEAEKSGQNRQTLESKRKMSGRRKMFKKKEKRKRLKTKK